MRAPPLLVVDDNEDNRYTLTRRLKREGYTNLTTANDGREALEALAQRPFDLVLLDIMMPIMNGYEVLEHINGDEALRDIPVIMISALDDIDSVVKCIELGAQDYLPKPFNPVLLRARIGACLEKKRLHDREVDYLREIEAARKRSDELLAVILPLPAVEELKATDNVTPRRYDNVAVCSPTSSRSPPIATRIILKPCVESAGLRRGVRGGRLQARAREDQDDRRRLHGDGRTARAGRRRGARLRALWSRHGHRVAGAAGALARPRRHSPWPRGRRHRRPPEVFVRSLGRHWSIPQRASAATPGATPWCSAKPPGDRSPTTAGVNRSAASPSRARARSKMFRCDAVDV